MSFGNWIYNKYVRYRVNNYVKRWAKKTNAEGVSDCVVVRTYELNDIYIDFYWRIKKTSADRHIDSIYQRCSWNSARRMLHDVEHHQLPHKLRKLRREGTI